MENTIDETKHIPRKVAQTGRVDLSRSDVTRIVGRLFKLRMGVNLVSNVLGMIVSSILYAFVSVAN